MNAKANKFTFDTVFGPTGDAVSDDARARQRKSYTQGEIDEMRATARTEGKRAGEVRAIEALAEAAERTAQTVREVLQQSHAEIEAVRRDATDLALSIARKFAPAALAHMPVDDVEQTFRAAIHQAIGEPRVVLRAAPRVAEALAARIEAIAHEEGFEGRVQISADTGLSGGDCRIEWRGGGAERSEAAIEAAIADLIGRHFARADDETPKEG